MTCYCSGGHRTANSCTNTSTETSQSALSTYSRSHDSLSLTHAGGLFLITWGIIALIASGIMAAIFASIYRAIFRPIEILRRYWRRARRSSLRRSAIRRRALSYVRIPVRPFLNLFTAGRRRRIAAANLLEINRVQRQSRIQTAINKDHYPSRRRPRPSTAWRRCNRKSPRRDVSTRECTICSENLMDFRFPDRNVTVTCQHEQKVCLSCVSREIRRNLDNNSWTEARCVTCQGLLSSDDIAEFAFAEDFAK
jgi:hypothetical protein